MEHASPGQLKKFDVGGKIASAVGLAGFLFCLLLKNSRLAHVELTYFVTSMLVFILGTQLWIMSNYRRKLKKDLYQYSTSNQYRIEHIYDNDDEEQSVTTYVESQKNNICIRKAS